MTSVIRSSGDNFSSGLLAVRKTAGDVALQAARFIVSLNSRDFTPVDNAAEEMFGTESEESLECVALMSLWQHVYVLNPKMFSYLRCLREADRSQLQKYMIKLLIDIYSDPQERRSRILSGYVIYRSEWDQMIRSIPLTTTYEVWRYATWVELGVQTIRNSQSLSQFHTRDRTFPASIQWSNTVHLLLQGRSGEPSVLLKTINSPNVYQPRERGTEGRYSHGDISRNGGHGRRVYDGHGGYGVHGRHGDYNIGDEVVTEEVPTAVAVLEVVVPEAVTVVVMRD